MRKAADIVTRKISEHTFLMPMRPGEAGLWLYELNETAAFVWGAIDKARSEGELLELVCSEFDVPLNEARADLETLLGELKSVGALS